MARLFSEQAQQLLADLKDRLPPELMEILRKRESPVRLPIALADEFPPTESYVDKGRRAWELTGLFYFHTGRAAEALELFYAMYDQDLKYQESTGQFLCKGTPLVWIGECHKALGRPLLAKRYFMMSLGDDAIASHGHVSSEKTGSYFRLVWQHSLPDPLFKAYAAKAHELAQEDPEASRYPEWLLLKMDDRWVSSPPSIEESHYYHANSRLIHFLLGRTGDGTGVALEELAQYLLSEVPGWRVARRTKTYSTDYDVVCSVSGIETDFRAELGRYFIGECKDWSSPADISAFAKFCRVLDSVKCRFGVLFSREGITGDERTTGARREQLKMFQDRGTIIVVVTENDIQELARGADFIVMLRDKYERVRLDLRDGAEPH